MVSFHLSLSSRPTSIDGRHLRFYVNIATGKSQWDPPQAPVPSADGPPPSEPPPSYNQTGPADPAAAAAVMGDKKQSMASNNPYNPTNPSQSRASPSMIDDDARLAAKLQAEEDARGSSGGSRGPTPGASADYYNEPSRPQSTGAGYPPRALFPEPHARAKTEQGRLPQQTDGQELRKQLTTTAAVPLISSTTARWILRRLSATKPATRIRVPPARIRGAIHHREATMRSNSHQGNPEVWELQVQPL